MNPDINEYTIKPIGKIKTLFKDKVSAPVQGVFTNGSSGTVEIFEEYESGLKDLDGFSHIYLIYVFDRAGKIELIRKPFLDDTPRGLFSTRHPCRPNSIGITIVRLISRKGRFLEVEGIDVLDETPLIDIKPYIRRFDSFPEASEGWLENVGERKKPENRE